MADGKRYWSCAEKHGLVKVHELAMSEEAMLADVFFTDAIKCGTVVDHGNMCAKNQLYLPCIAWHKTKREDYK